MSSTVVRATERTRYWRDEDDADATSKRYDEIRSHTWDLDKSGELPSGVTVSSVAYVDSGISRSSSSNTTTTITFVGTKTGETEITATLSNGETRQRVVRWYNSDSGEVRDYRNR